MKGVGLVAILLLAAPAMAEMGSYSFEHALPVAVEGSRAVTASDADLYVHGTNGQLGGYLFVEEGTLTRVIQRATGYISPSEPELGVKWTQTVQEKHIPLANQALQLDRLPEFQLLATDATVRLDQGNQQAPLHIGVLGASKVVSHESQPDVEFTLDGYDAKPFVHAIRGGQLTTRATDAAVQVESGTIFLGNAKLYLAGEEYVANERVEQHPGQIYNPLSRTWTGGGSHDEYVFEYFLLDLSRANLQFQVRDLPVHIYSEQVDVDVLGTVAFPDATGTVHVGDETHVLVGHDLDLAGKLQFDTSSSQLQGTTRGEGDITKVRYAQASHDYDWTVAAIGLGAILVAIGGWVTGGFKWLSGAGIGLVAGYARVHGQEVLEHPGRAEVYNLVKAEPGMHFNDLLQRLSFGQSTLNYHLRVLEKNDFVTRVKDGRYARFFDRQSGQYSSTRKEAVSTLRNDTTAAIAVHVLRNPGVVQKELSGQFGIAPSTVSWHIQRLCSQGLIDKERDHNHVRYYMGDAWNTLPEAELTRFGLTG
ncbi:MAG: winged helix-turn-helix transcriptional regulator [Thermoplasmatota archaeon]